MRALLAVSAVLLAAGSASAVPRVLVCLPKDSAALAPQVQRAFAWTEISVLTPESVAERFPASDASRAVAQDERLLDQSLHTAEADFVALRFDQAAQRLEECAKIFDRLPPSVRHESAFVRLQLLRGRVGQARGDERAFTDAIARAAEAAVDVELDEAEYPPQIRQAFLSARAQVRARPRRPAEVASEPAGAEVEINGQLAGRTPAALSLPPGRCLLSVTRAGYKPYLATCPTEPKVVVALEAATRDGLRDQLRERLATDPAWFLEPLLLETLAAESDARWIVALDRDKARGLKALVFSAAEHALKPLEPARFVETEIDKLSDAVRALVQRTQRLEAQIVETPSGMPALEARSADPGLGTAIAFVRRKGSVDYLRLSLSPQGPGRFSSVLPLSLSSDGAWDVEYYAEAFDGSGALACRAGEAAAPLGFRRDAGAAVAATPAWYQRWYVWTAVGVVAAGAAATGVYFGTRSNDVTVTFGAHK